MSVKTANNCLIAYTMYAFCEIMLEDQGKKMAQKQSKSHKNALNFFQLKVIYELNIMLLVLTRALTYTLTTWTLTNFFEI